MDVPKYSRVEIERRWLVASSKLPVLSGAPALIVDRYLSCGRLRLRRMTSPASVAYKLCKKYPGERFDRITNLYLDLAEYNALAQLPGYEIEKARYPFDKGSIDVYESERKRLAIFEREFESEEEALAFQPPDFVLAELGPGSQYSGYEIAKRFCMTGELTP